MKTVFSGFVLALFYLPSTGNQRSAPTQIAFLPDIHFHDVYAEFNDGSFKGIWRKQQSRNHPHYGSSAAIHPAF